MTKAEIEIFLEDAITENGGMRDNGEYHVRITQTDDDLHVELLKYKIEE